MNTTTDIELTPEDIKEIQRLHALWVACEPDGRRADLRGVNLRGTDLRYAILRGTDLSGTHLRDANLSSANLSRTNLRGADMRGTDLSYANLSNASLSCASLSGADMRCASLSDAILSRADLSGANLQNSAGNGREVKTIQSDIWTITYTADRMQIGCQNHAIADWWAFDDERINETDSRALEWWRVWKPILQQIIETSPATPMGREE